MKILIFIYILFHLLLPFSSNAYFQVNFASNKNNSTSYEIGNKGDGIKITNLRNEVILTGFIKSGDSILIHTPDNSIVFLYRFSKSFSPAPPPMFIRGVDSSPSMELDTLLEIQSGKILRLEKTGLYFAQTDTTSNIGKGFRVVNRDYPKFKKVPHLTQTMIYISTMYEIEAVIEAKKKKHVFNSFWLNMGGDINNSQRLIKMYFDRVTYANQNFTSYKEGWKTDKGMIYIVFGKPNNIIKNNGTESWVYIGKRKQVTFDFSSKKNLFTDKHFKLRRHSGLQRSWFKQVEKWRTGTIE